MLSREERILSEILTSRGLVDQRRVEACARERGAVHASLADALVEAGDITPAQAREAADEARALGDSLCIELPEGKQLGDFVLVREVGRGGMGIVYEAEQQGLGRRVALKVLPAGAALDGRLAIRFLREARAAAKLRHPGIVPVYASGQAEGVLYYAMELVEGQTLEALLEAGPLAPREAARIAIELAEALDHAHRAGLVHRDVKPGNVLLTANGRPKITDFGLVLEASASSLTLSRFVLGTPAFVAPEQIRGERADPRSDVYSLGAVLYAMLAGRPPFHDDVPAMVLARALNERPKALASLRSGLPPRLVAACERAMAKEPAARHATAAEFAAELEAVLAGGTTERPESARSWRRAAAWSAGLLGAFAVTAYALVSLREDSAPGAAAAAPYFRPLVQTPGRKTSPALSPDGRWLAYASDADGDWDLYLADLGRGGVENLTPDSAGVDRSPVFSPDGRSIAYTSSVVRADVIAVLDLSTRRSRQVAEHVASDLDWSADGRELLFSDRRSDEPGASAVPGKLFALELETGRLRPLSGVYGSQPEASIADAAIAFVHQGGGRTDLWRMSQSGGEAVRLTDDDALEWSPVWSSSGEQIYFGGELAGVGRLLVTDVADAADGTRRRSRTLTDAIFPAPFYLTRAKRGSAMALIPMKQDGRLYRIELDPPQGNVFALPARFLAANSPDVSPDGQRVVFTAVTSQEDLAIGGLDGSAPRLLTDDAFRDRTPRWSPDGSRIAFQSDRSGKMEIWTIRPDGGDLRRLTSTDADAAQPVWSPGGSRLAYTVRGKGALVVSSSGEGEAEALPPAGAAPFEPSSWSPDGTEIAGTAGGAMFVYSPSSRTYRQVGEAVGLPVWLDDERLAFTTAHEVRAVVSRSGDEQPLLSFAPAAVSPHIAVTPDRRSLVVSLSSSPEVVWGIGLDAPLKE